MVCQFFCLKNACSSAPLILDWFRRILYSQLLGFRLEWKAACQCPANCPINNRKRLCISPDRIEEFVHATQEITSEARCSPGVSIAGGCCLLRKRTQRTARTTRTARTKWTARIETKRVVLGLIGRFAIAVTGPLQRHGVPVPCRCIIAAWPRRVRRMGER